MEEKNNKPRERKGKQDNKNTTKIRRGVIRNKMQKK